MAGLRYDPPPLVSLVAAAQMYKHTCMECSVECGVVPISQLPAVKIEVEYAGILTASEAFLALIRIPEGSPWPCPDQTKVC